MLYDVEHIHFARCSKYPMNMCSVIRRAIPLHTFTYLDTDTLIALLLCRAIASHISLTHSLSFGRKEIASINQINYCYPENEMNASTKSNVIDEIRAHKIDDF